MNRTVLTLHWLARICSGVILLFVTVFAAMYFLGGGEQSPRPLDATDLAVIATSGLMLFGLAIGWKWEPAGGAVALVGILTLAAFNPKMLAFPGTLVAVTALLHFAAWWTKQGSRQCSAGK